MYFYRKIIAAITCFFIVWSPCARCWADPYTDAVDSGNTFGRGIMPSISSFTGESEDEDGTYNVNTNLSGEGDSSNFSISQYDLFPGLSSSEEDVSSLEGLFEDEEAMTGSVSTVNGQLAEEESETGEAYRLMETSSANNSHPDLTNDSIWTATDNALQGVFTSEFTDCETVTETQETVTSYHLSDYKNCQRVNKPTDPCTLTHTYEAIPVVSSSFSNTTISSCGLGCSDIVISGVRSEAGGECVTTELLSSIHISESSAISSVFLEEATWTGDALIVVAGTTVWGNDGATELPVECNSVNEFTETLSVNLLSYFQSTSDLDVSLNVASLNDKTNSLRIRVLYDPTAVSVDDSGWTPSSCLETLDTVQSSFCAGSIWSCDDVPTLDASGCYVSTDGTICLDDLVESPHADISAFCTQMTVTPACNFNVGQMECYTDASGVEQCPYNDGTNTNSCRTYIDQGCSYVSTSCLEGATTDEGFCMVFSDRYDCGEDVEVVSEKTVESYVCSGGQCATTTTTSEEETEEQCIKGKVELTCPEGSEFVDGACLYPYTCPENYIYNTVRERCERSPDCPDDEPYDSELKQCLILGAIIPQAEKYESFTQNIINESGKILSGFSSLFIGTAYAAEEEEVWAHCTMYMHNTRKGGGSYWYREGVPNGALYSATTGKVDPEGRWGDDCIFYETASYVSGINPLYPGECKKWSKLQYCNTSTPEAPQNYFPPCENGDFDLVNEVCYAEATTTQVDAECLDPGELIDGECVNNSCATYEDSSNCSYVRSECRSGYERDDGTCESYSVTYTCATTVTTEETVDESCLVSVRCMGTECVTQDSSNSESFQKAVALATAAEFIANDMTCDTNEYDTGVTEESYDKCSVFQGNPYSCKVAVGGWQNCCDQPVAVSLSDYIQLTMNVNKLTGASEMIQNSELVQGAWTSIQSGMSSLGTSSVGQAWSEMTEPITTAWESISGSVADMLYDEAAQQTGEAICNASGEVLTGAVEQTMQLLTDKIATWVYNTFGEMAYEMFFTSGAGTAINSVGTDGASTVTGAAFGGIIGSLISFVMWVYLIYQILNLLVQMIWECEEPEFELATKRELKSCTFIGEHCVNDILGSCIEAHEVYCCYDSPLSRILNEQITEQLGISYGDLDNPQCEGIPIARMEEVDWDAINLDEWLAILAISGALPGSENSTTDLDIESLTGTGSTFDFEGLSGIERENAAERALSRLDSEETSSVNEDLRQGLYQEILIDGEEED